MEESKLRAIAARCEKATKDDQDFIAHARQDIPALLGEIAKLNRLLAARAETMGE